MYIRLDVFAGMLGLRHGELLHAVRTTGYQGICLLTSDSRTFLRKARKQFLNAKVK